MSRRVHVEAGGPVGFPRVSGDEPGPADLDRVLLVFSPRERG